MGHRKKVTEVDYWKTINYYRWEFLRRSSDYQEFYKRIKKEYLSPLKKYEADLLKDGLNKNQVISGKLASYGPPHLVEQHRKLESAKSLLRDESKRFGLHWYFISKHYPKTLLDPKKSLKNKDHIVFADYQIFSPFYDDVKFQPEIRRIVECPEPRYFHTMQSSGYIFFAINTWGNKPSEEEIRIFSEIIRDHLTEEIDKGQIQFMGNPFLLASGESIKIEPSKEGAEKIAEHFREKIEALDYFRDAMKKTTKKTAGYALVAQTFSGSTPATNLSESAIRIRVNSAEMYLSEVANGRFFIPEMA